MKCHVTECINFLYIDILLWIILINFTSLWVVIYVDVILPLPLQNTFTYEVPSEFEAIEEVCV